MKTLYNTMPVEEMNSDEGIFTFGDEIASQFYYGNFTDAIDALKDMNSSAKEFLEYLENRAEELGYNDVCNPEFYSGHFSPQFFINLGASIN